ncbi:hypothetical protein VCHA35O141_110112 [Vibrio chagasii]|nr:hypothetical protein VCHA31O73_100037 [Vibrio chagasii]CAH6801398.1 hypothetical protein VCHA35O141_110112 [Vibrio chagasii]CAH6908870.1 hypothetical protein VCHA53O480_100037 [Vibrio chagasii]CAH6942166.1 hypothetical protein VCHA50O396_100037 [Vibrio chagasii]CAH7002900.1 hypothetical protein VCHA48P434_150108 [Vibrio chagasii]
MNTSVQATDTVWAVRAETLNNANGNVKQVGKPNRLVSVN